ncbi:MAG: polysaccharide biosynthesis protein [Oscillospiraceae bacterium]|nr:polysaccharide biosynthesis protein [Oscillospiraceae bacterium]
MEGEKMAVSGGNDMNRKKKSLSDEWHPVTVLLMLYDLFAAGLSYFLALWLRFDCKYSQIPEEYFSAWIKFLPIYAIAVLIIHYVLKLYQSIWKFASFIELKRIIVGTGLLGLLHAVLITLLFKRMPISYYVIGIAIQLMLVTAVRFAYRFVILEKNKLRKSHQKSTARRVMLIGAGSAGQMILRDLHNAKEANEIVCCIIDDDKSKWGRFIEDVPIVGGRDDILLNAEKYRIEKIILALPSATEEQRRDVLDICKETACELKNLPSVYKMVTDAVRAEHLKDVAVEDLLGRESVKVNMDEIFAFIKGKVILVTGGGGSIGSELCRQVAQHNPKQLIVFDIYENNAHAIGLELKDKYPDLNLEVLIGSVRDSRRINQVFAKYKPDVVYHAAAHKHVPLMEDSPCESIKNNAVGTYKTAYAAMMNGCKRFVLISTDKAVNPTNIMGASKRLCEMIIQSFDKKIRDGKANELLPLHVHNEDTDGSMLDIKNIAENAETEFVAVRFGNVLGSNGSVIPRFKEQIAKGGPVTVTHPDIIRYFMTIPEAASLVLQAGTYAAGGEIFVLDMGSPVKIDTLARNMIKLSGLQPDVDIKISYTGLRAGEKLYEEKLMSEEGLKTTPNQLIHIGSPIPFDTDEFLVQLQMLMTAAYDGNEDKIRDLVAQVVTTYRPAGEQGSEEKGEAYVQQMNIVMQSRAEKATV